MAALTSLLFQDTGMVAQLAACGPAQLDTLGFGVIGFDAQTLVQVYNLTESQLSGLAPERVLGRPMFSMVAPCMNNFMVAQRFEDAAAAGEPLDETLDYVLTLRMRPIKVVLRLLAEPGQMLRYVLLQRRS